MSTITGKTGWIRCVGLAALALLGAFPLLTGSAAAGGDQECEVELHMDAVGYAPGQSMTLYASVDAGDEAGTKVDLYAGLIFPASSPGVFFLTDVSGGMGQGVTPLLEDFPLADVAKEKIWQGTLPGEMPEGVYTWFLVAAKADANPVDLLNLVAMTHYPWVIGDEQMGSLYDDENTLRPASMQEAELKAGDLLLYQGDGLISDGIVAFEKINYKKESKYSHVSLYIGEGYVMEMLEDGLNTNTVSDSIKDAVYVDVYRYQGTGGAEVADLAARKASAYPATPYAYGQIGILALAGFEAEATVMTAALVTVDLTAGGKKKMICSELPRWAYDDAGYPLGVTSYWSSLDPYLLTKERKYDYTTPNILALDAGFQLVGALK